MNNPATPEQTMTPSLPDSLLPPVVAVHLSPKFFTEGLHTRLAGNTFKVLLVLLSQSRRLVTDALFEHLLSLNLVTAGDLNHRVAYLYQRDLEEHTELGAKTVATQLAYLMEGTDPLIERRRHRTPDHHYTRSLFLLHVEEYLITENEAQDASANQQAHPQNPPMALHFQREILPPASMSQPQSFPIARDSLMENLPVDIHDRPQPFQVDYRHISDVTAAPTPQPERAQHLWSHIQTGLMKRLNPATYATWFANSYALELGRSSGGAPVLIIGVDDEEHARYLHTEPFWAALREATRAVTRPPIAVRFVAPPEVQYG